MSQKIWVQTYSTIVAAQTYVRTKLHLLNLQFIIIFNFLCPTEKPFELTSEVQKENRTTNVLFKVEIGYVFITNRMYSSDVIT